MPGTGLNAQPKETRLDLEDARLLYLIKAKGSLGLGTELPILSSDVPGHLLPPWLGLGQGERGRPQFVKLLCHMTSMRSVQRLVCKDQVLSQWVGSEPSYLSI